MILKNNLEILTSVKGISGQENDIANCVKKMLEPFVDEIIVDGMHNVVGKRNSLIKDAPRIMLNAHIDQVGLVVTSIIDGGFVKAASFAADVRSILGLKMLILSKEGPISCIGTAIPPHLQGDGDAMKAVDINDIYFDTGLSYEKLCDLVRPGDPVVFDSKLEPLLNDRVTAAALDDRVGVACILNVLENLKNYQLPFELIVLFSTMEESNHQGCLARIPIDKPDYIITVDACHGETIGCNEYDRVHKLGCGAVITIGANSVPKFSNYLIDIARKYDIPFEREAMPSNTFTDAWVAQTAYLGAYTAIVSIPLRNMHTPIEVIDIADAKAVVALLTQFCKIFGGEL